MKSDTHDQENIRRYLLGRVPLQDLPALEERIFLDSELYEELSIVEDELIDEYLHGELAPSEREQFESHFMAAPERQEKVRFASALKTIANAESASQTREDSVTDKHPKAALDVAETSRQSRPFFSFLPFKNPIVSYGLAAAMILALVGVSWLIWKSLPTRDPDSVLAVVLTPGLIRSDGEIKRIVIPENTGTIRLQLLLTDNQYHVFEASLLDSDGRALTRKDNLKPESVNPPAVFFDISARLLPRGDYRVKLSGLTANGDFQSVSSYNFRVMR